MYKRPSEDSQPESEPAAKRSATQNENEIDIIDQQKLQSARAALNRLDYKNSLQICTELIDSNASDLANPLLLRSLALERRGRLQESVVDGERALKLRESKKAHLRCSFAYLAKALHHLELALEQPDQEGDTFLTNANLEELKDEMKRSKAREAEDPFSKVPADVFLRVTSFLDPRSIAISSACSRFWRASIQGFTEIFRTFQMTGQGKNIAGGIRFYSSRCGNSIRSIEIRVQKTVRLEDHQLLHSAISPSSSTLERLSISHRSDLSKVVLQIASECPLLKSLSSTRVSGPFHYSGMARYLDLPSSWKPNQLQEFEWNDGHKGLGCNEVLLKSLQRAERVNITSHRVSHSWVMDLLSLASATLFDVKIEIMNSRTLGEIRAPICLPKLISLSLDRAPCSKSTRDASPFFQSLHAPNLDCLFIKAFRFKDLQSFRQESHPKQFIGTASLGDNDSCAFEGGEAEASVLVKAIKSWDNLRVLDLRLTATRFTAFYSHLIKLLTSGSTENVESGYGEQPMLPALTSLLLGYEKQVFPDGPTVCGRAVVSLISSRLGNGLSTPIETFEINDPLRVDGEILSWLQENVPSLRIKLPIDKRYPLKSPLSFDQSSTNTNRKKK